MFDKIELKALIKQLEADLAAAKRVLALEENPALARVASLLKAREVAAQQPNLFESATKPDNGQVTGAEVQAIILKFATEFKAADVTAAVGKEFPRRELARSTIPNALHWLKKKKKITEVSKRAGNNGAVYVKT
ncbi:MAG: hypothetical protein ABSF95_15775 [Verrucomicrobiota bacterium]